MEAVYGKQTSEIDLSKYGAVNFCKDLGKQMFDSFRIIHLLRDGG